MFKLTEKDINRFWSKIQVNDENECWPWIAKSTSSGGYGLIRIKGNKHNVVASRISCFMANGNPPEGLKNALHSCDNPPCCNPNHLRWGTPKDNRKDCIDRNRASKPPVNYPGRHTGKMPKGKDLHNASMDETQVREIWRLHLLGGYTSFQIADMTSAKQHAVYDLCRGKSWRHLPDAPSVEALKQGGVRRGFNQFS